MRKLKLQMHFDGIDWDNDMVNFCVEDLKSVNSILLGRKTAEGFIPYWAEVAEKSDPNDINTPLGRPLTDIPKVVFSNKLKTNTLKNTTIIKGDFAGEIKSLKEREGKDIIVYGGHSFVSSLIEHKLIDEYYLFVNPLAVSKDEPVLKFINNSLQLTLKECKSFPCGTILLCYQQNLK
jgi:dihydrofolate reductase